MFHRNDRDDRLKALQVLDSAVIYTCADYEIGLTIMISKNKNEVAMQGQIPERGYFVFKGFRNYVNVLGASTQAIVFERFKY